MAKKQKSKELEVKPEYSDYSVVLENLAFDYTDDQHTLKDISLKIKKGSYISLIGHNGSGKSTLARLIIGILVQLNGEIYINGIRMTDDSVLELRKHIGIVFQNPDNQFIGSTVRDDIAFSLENLCVEPSKMGPLIEEYAAKVGMTDFLDKEPQNLSGGQKQRVAIAGTLIRKPDILIMDESTSMLDPKGKNEIFDLIHHMKDENPDLTVISITHEIDEAYRSDEVVVLNDGKVFMQGTPKEVFAHYKELATIGLDIPFYDKLALELDKYGIDIHDVNSLGGLVEKLCQSN